MFKLKNLVAVLIVMFVLGGITTHALTLTPQTFESPLLPPTGGAVDILEMVKAFLVDYAVKAIIGLIFLDVALGTAAALRARQFKFDVFVQFYRTMVLPDLLGYLALAIINTLLPTLIPEYLMVGQAPENLMTGLVGLVFATITARLAKSVMKNIQKLWGDALPLPPGGTIIGYSY